MPMLSDNISKSLGGVGFLRDCDLLRASVTESSSSCSSMNHRVESMLCDYQERHKKSREETVRQRTSGEISLGLPYGGGKSVSLGALVQK